MLGNCIFIWKKEALDLDSVKTRDQKGSKDRERKLDVLIYHINGFFIVFVVYIIIAGKSTTQDPQKLSCRGDRSSEIPCLYPQRLHQSPSTLCDSASSRWVLKKNKKSSRTLSGLINSLLPCCACITILWLVS